jgi:hypothetical protein
MFSVRPVSKTSSPQSLFAAGPVPKKPSSAKPLDQKPSLFSPIPPDASADGQLKSMMDTMHKEIAELRGELAEYKAHTRALFSMLPLDAPADLQLKLMIVYYDHMQKEIAELRSELAEYKAHAKALDVELDRDDNAKAERDIIQGNDKLRNYYQKLCELTHFIKASQSIATRLVTQRDDIHDIAVKLAAETGKSVLHFIPIVSGLSCVIKGLQTADYLAHGIDKHRYSINLMRFTRGLGVGADERLIQRFARKLTLAKKNMILNPELSLAKHPQCGLVQRMIDASQSYVHEGAQTLWEFCEGHPYSPQEKLALADILKMTDAIATEVLLPVTQGSEQERMDQLLKTMLDFMMPKEHIESLEHECSSSSRRSLAPGSF